MVQTEAVCGGFDDKASLFLLIEVIGCNYQQGRGPTRMRIFGTLTIVYGFVLATVGDAPAVGFTVAAVGWLIRRANR